MKLSNPKIVSRITEESFAHFVQPFDGTDEDRISRLRSAAMEKSKIDNAPTAKYGWDYPASYFKDFAGPQTSNWDSAVLRCFAEVLEVPLLNRSKTKWHWNSYNPANGKYELPDCPPISISELRAAVDARILELGLSKPKIWEWYNEPSGPGEEYWRFDLQTRIKKFRWKATGE